MQCYLSFSPSSFLPPTSFLQLPTLPLSYFPTSLPSFPISHLPPLDHSGAAGIREEIRVCTRSAQLPLLAADAHVGLLQAGHPQHATTQHNLPQLVIHYTLLPVHC